MEQQSHQARAYLGRDVCPGKRHWIVRQISVWPNKLCIVTMHEDHLLLAGVEVSKRVATELLMTSCNKKVVNDIE